MLHFKQNLFKKLFDLFYFSDPDQLQQFSIQKQSIVLMHLNRGGKNLEALQYSFVTGNWKQLEYQFGPRMKYCLGEINGNIFLVGGHNHQSGQISAVDVIYENGNTAELYSLSRRRENFGMCEFGDRYLLICGGCTYDGEFQTKSCDIYDTFTNKWEKTSNLLTKRSFFSLVYFNGSILALGGSSGQYEILDTIESFNIKTKKWSLWPTRLLQKRSSHVAVGYDDRFYVFGGRINHKITGSIEMYSQQTDQFTYVTPMPFRMHSFGYCKRNECIYLMGGTNEDLEVDLSKTTKLTTTTLVYNTEFDSWNTWVDLPYKINSSPKACCI